MLKSSRSGSDRGSGDPPADATINTMPTDSELGIYKSSLHHASFGQRVEEEKEDIQYQKLWAASHSVLYLAISIQIMWLLADKADAVNDFYTQSQCCYCSWIVRTWDYHYNHDKQIEYAHCEDKWGAYDPPAVCNIGGREYCSDTYPAPTEHRQVSTTSTFMFIPFRKSYLYYGILGIATAVCYSIFIIVATFKYSLRLSAFLFIGNIVVSIQCYYNYIKVYQYALTEYEQATCIEEPPDAQQACYQNTVGQTLSECLSFMVTFFTFFFVYPFVYYLVHFCCVRRCGIEQKCAAIQYYLEKVLLYVAVIGGMASICLCLVTLIIVVQRTNVAFIGSADTNEQTQRILCICTGSVLFLMSFSVFCLPHCRKRCRYMVKPMTVAKWMVSDVETEDCERFDEFRNLSRRSSTHSAAPDLSDFVGVDRKTTMKSKTISSVPRNTKSTKQSKAVTPLLYHGNDK